MDLCDLRNNKTEKFSLQDLCTSYNGTPKMDLMLEVYDAADRDLWGWIEFRTDLWKRETIESLVAHFINIIEQIPYEVSTFRVSELDILTEKCLNL